MSYFRLPYSNRFFATEIWKIFAENRKTDHAECVNNSRNFVMMYSGYIVMACNSIQSNKAKDRIDKLRCTVRGPFQIIRDTYRGSGIVRKLHKPDSP